MTLAVVKPLEQHALFLNVEVIQEGKKGSSLGTP